jgi:pyruvate formate lyase activating enzyme
MIKGNIFNIQRFSTEDGPGIRTTVFTKGCPLRCLWCSNPESQKLWPEIAHRDSLCNQCGRCIEVCDSQAISIVDKNVQINRRRCTRCGKCVEVCIPEAIRLIGNEISVDEVFQEIRKDIQYYRSSGGGVTVGGGEPLQQPAFVAALLKRCQDEGIHTCIDTSGYADTSALEKVIPHVSLILYDIKYIDPIVHRKLTGRSNGPIIRNLELIAKRKIPTIIRVPVIPGFTDTDENITAIAQIVTRMKHLGEINLLPYHKYGMSKYKQLDRRYKLNDLESTTDMKLQKLKEIFEAFGLNCQIKA